MATKKEETKEIKKKNTVNTKTSAKKTTTKTTSKSTNKKSATAKTTSKKAATVKTTSKKATSKTASSKKNASNTTKTPAKQTSLKKAPDKGIKVVQQGTEGNLLDLLGREPVSAKKTKTTSTTKTKKETKDKKEAPTRQLKKPKTLNKEEKALFKRLEEAFNYVANLTMVIEERTLDSKVISDLTLSELHVLEIVNKESAIPMTKVANQLKITVGSLTTCVNRLVKKEYLFRERDAQDHRIIKVSTTQKAKKALKAHDLFHEQILWGVLEGVTIRDATKVMAQFVRTLENYINPKERVYEKPIDKKKKKSV